MALPQSKKFFASRKTTDSTESLWMRLQPVRAQSKMFFVQHLAVMLRAGLPLDDALTTLAEETEYPRFKNILTAIAESIRSGTSLTEALAVFPSVFSELFVNMVRAGEESGKLEEVLVELHTQLKKEHTLSTKVRGALLYPSIILVVMSGIGVFMMTVVIPRLVSIFDSINAELPVATRVVIAVSRFITTHGIVVLLAAILLVAACIAFIRNPKGRVLWHGALLRMPVFGSIIKQVNLARLTRTLASLLKTDIHLARALTITGGTVSNAHYTAHMLRCAEEIKTGTTLAVLLQEQPRLFPPLVRQMVSVGETTGSLDTILEEIASFYEESVSTTLDALPALIEPLLIVALGLGVGGLAVAIVMPMYTLAQQF